jgi:hypothetical protein
MFATASVAKWLRALRCGLVLPSVVTVARTSADKEREERLPDDRFREALASSTVGGDRRRARPQSKRKPRSYQSREIELAASVRVCDNYRTPPPVKSDSEFANVPREPPS